MRLSHDAAALALARSLKLLALPYPFLTIQSNIILSTNRSYVISPCVTNNNKVKLEKELSLADLALV